MRSVARKSFAIIAIVCGFLSRKWHARIELSSPPESAIDFYWDFEIALSRML